MQRHVSSSFPLNEPTFSFTKSNGSIILFIENHKLIGYIRMLLREANVKIMISLT